MKNFNYKFLFFILLTLSLVVFFIFNIKSVFASTIITDNIQADTIWTKDGSPFIIKNNIDIARGITLTIDPGVVVKFDPNANASIAVFGDLVVNGEADDKVYFTSNYDDTLGGDTDDDYYCYDDIDVDGNFLGEVCDGSWLIPSRNDWNGINFIDSHNNYIKNAVFKYVNSFAYLDHTYLNLKNVELKNSNFGVFARVSNIDANVFNCTDFSSSCLYATNHSNVNWVNSKIDKIHSDAVYVYDSSTLNITNFLIQNVYNSSAMYIFRGSYLNAQNLEVKNIIDNFNYGIYIYDNSHASINDSKFNKAPDGSDIIIFDSDEYIHNPSSLEIESSLFDGGVGSAVLAFGNGNLPIKISNSIIRNFDYFAVENYSPEFIINAEDNFWGNSTGPFHPDKNENGTAGIVSDYVNFIPFCENEKCKPRDPVILIPGIMGTEIFKDYDDKKEIWPNPSKLIFSITDNFLNDLALTVDGEEDSNKPMRLGDIIRGTHLDILGVKYDSKVFEELIKELERDGYVENTNLFVFPYDWRKSNANSALKLKDKINEILTLTGADKVDLVAHSMGGLVAKKYIADNGASKVDQLIFIGTPQLGAPKAFKVIMEGDDMGISKGKYSFLTPSKVKYISQNMPGVFELLPSRKYIDGQSDFSGYKYITDYITPSLSVSKNPPRPDLSYNETINFFKNQKINTKMLGFADTLHNDIDNLDLSGVKVSNFIGCGTTKTIGRITVKKKSSGILLWKKLVNTYNLEYENGDDTVPLRSADDSYGKKYYVKGYTHSELPSVFGIEELVGATLRGKKLIDFPNVSFNKNDCFIKGKTITLQSTLPMLDYLVYDSFGNYTGPVKSIDLKAIQDPSEIESTSEIEYGIPGVQYDKFGSTTSIFLPEGGDYKIIVNSIPYPVGGGGGSGSTINIYDLNIQNVNADDTIICSVNYNNVPVNNSGESFQIEIPADTFPGEINAEVPPVIEVDDNGDGNFESEIPPTVILNEIQTNDLIVPSTTSIIAGNLVSLSATDDNSGISNIQYSLDGGNTWTEYINPFEVNLIPGGNDIVVEYFSTDNAGNVEQIQTMTIEAPPLPEPIILNTSIVHSGGGGILLLAEEKNIKNTEVKTLALNNTNISENQITKENKELTLSNLNIFDLKKIFTSKKQESSFVVKNEENKNSKNDYNTLNSKSQTALTLNSNTKFNIIWFFVIIIVFIVGVLIVRNNKKR